MEFHTSEEHQLIRDAVRKVCSAFPDEYWAARDEAHEFPWKFYEAMASAGWIGVAIPEAYGGSGRGITPFVTYGDEFPVTTNLDDKTDNFRGGVRFEKQKWHVTLEQGGTAFKDDQHVFTSDLNPGNRTTTLLGKDLYLQDYETQADLIKYSI